MWAPPPSSCSVSARPKPLLTPVTSQVPRAISGLCGAHAHERLDRPPLVHRLVPVDDMIEVGLEVEDATGVDAPGQDVREKLRDVPAGRGHATAKANVAEDHGVDRHLDAVGRADCADHGSG